MSMFPHITHWLLEYYFVKNYVCLWITTAFIYNNIDIILISNNNQNTSMKSNEQFIDLNAEDTCEANICDLLNEIQILKDQVYSLTKPVLNHKEASEYLNISPKYLYKLNSKKTIPYQTPNGGKINYAKIDLDNYLMSNRNKSIKELEAEL